VLTLLIAIVMHNTTTTAGTARFVDFLCPSEVQRRRNALPSVLPPPPHNLFYFLFFPLPLGNEVDIKTFKSKVSRFLCSRGVLVVTLKQTKGKRVRRSDYFQKEKKRCVSPCLWQTSTSQMRPQLLVSSKQDDQRTTSNSV
jgi:hypothetical protein